MNLDGKYAALNELKLHAEKKGYVLFDDILFQGDKYSLTIQDIDWLSNELNILKILTYENDPTGKTGKESDDIEDYAHIDYEQIFRTVIHEDNTLKNYIHRIQEITPAQYGEITRLKYLMIEGNKFARSRMIEIHLRRAIAVGLQFHQKYNIELSDAIQYASEGLVIACDRYHPDENGPFGSYSSMWMWQEIGRNSNYNPLIRLPVHISEKIRSAFAMLPDYDLADLLVDKELYSELATSAGWSTSFTFHIISILSGNIDIDRCRETDEDCLQVVDGNEKTFDTEIVKQMLTCLKLREREIIIARFGLDGNGCKTLEELGQKYHLTRERIRQMEVKAKKKMLAYIKINMKDLMSVGKCKVLDTSVSSKAKEKSEETQKQVTQNRSEDTETDNFEKKKIRLNLIVKENRLQTILAEINHKGSFVLTGAYTCSKENKDIISLFDHISERKRLIICTPGII